MKGTTVQPTARSATRSRRAGGSTPGIVLVFGVFVALTALLSLPIPGTAQTAQPELDAQAKITSDRATGRIRSPFCPGLMLEVCPSPQAGELRDTIRAWAQTGVSADSIVSLVVAQYGEEYRGYPEKAGRGWLAWLVPPGALLLGILAVATALKHLKRTGEARAVPVSESDEDEVRRALRELEEAEGPVF